MIFLPLLFHFNQHLNEHALLASQVCYRGLLQTLRANPAIKANIHMSGTLITALKWLDPEPIQIIRDGLRDGQFEMVGSTFAQNVAYATDDWDNAHQIELHKKVIEDTFGVTPTTFWNPERCWRQSLVPVIAGAGYKTITLEDHILEQSGGTQAKIYRTRQGEQTLNIVRDDEKLKHLFNFAAWFGDTRPLHSYLDSLPSPVGRGAGGEGKGEGVLAYAEDAEAMGLWGYMQGSDPRHTGVDPRQTWDRLGSLLKTLAIRRDIETSLFSDIPSPTEDISPIQEGAAAWMNASLAQTGLPYHEDGYQNWFDFNTNSPKVEKFRQFYADIRKHLQAAEGASKKKAAKRIFQLGLHSYLTHQYEFGCIGIGGDTYRGWLGANAALVMDSAMSLASLTKGHVEPIQFTLVDEINHDGIDEWIHINEPNLLITSPIGGRLLYWLDLKVGQLLVGNPSAVVSGKYEGDSIPPEARTHPNYWLPTPSDLTESPPRMSGQAHPEHPPTRMAKFIPAWVWENYTNPVTLAVRDIQQKGETPFLTAQQGAFCDEIWVDGVPAFNRREKMDVEGSREAIRFLKQLEPTLYFRKKYSVEKNVLTVVYTFTNKGDQSRTVQMTTISELALDYNAILQHGRAALDFLPDQPGVINPLTRETLILSTSLSPSEITRYQAMLGLNIGLSFEFSLHPAQPVKFAIQLIRAKTR